jgi:hypothetical protein
MASFSFQDIVSSGDLFARARKPLSTFIATLALALASQLVSMSSASAICDEPHTIYEFDNKSKTELVGYTTAWVANPITPTLSVGKTIEAHVEFSVSVGAEAGVILAKASTEVGVSVGASVSRTVTEEYQGDKPPKGKLARLVVYAEARQFRVRKLQLRAPCKYVPVGSWITVRAPQKTGTTIVREQYKNDTRASKSASFVSGADEAGGAEGSSEIEEVELPYDPEVQDSESTSGADATDEGAPDAGNDAGVVSHREDSLALSRMLAISERRRIAGAEPGTLRS